MDILIIEDELHNRRMLEGMILNLRKDWIVQGATESVDESVKFLKEHAPQLIFMDIQLTDGICFSIFDQVKISCPVIFTTAYDNYAIRAFKVNSIDYLLKPIKENELEQAILKFEALATNQISIPTSIDYAEIASAIRHGEKKYRTRFLIHGARSYSKLETQEIAYFISENKITHAVDFNKKEYRIDYSLEILEEELDPDQFFRASRNMILRIDVIEKVEDYFGGKLNVKLIPPFNQEVIVSRLKNTAFKEWLGK